MVKEDVLVVSNASQIVVPANRKVPEVQPPAVVQVVVKVAVNVKSCPAVFDARHNNVAPAAPLAQIRVDRLLSARISAATEVALLPLRSAQLTE